ncbi:hypothetical protein [Dyadobacter sp. LHD-138]|uniref:hypothetical protein n=1 Tax=Dyadobacter sp. LHD-138 TaxID=3071413 RepID=UPI0027E10D28|nr:hypothetical protein [Dyadobacter sp. LHD-138]MDQ6480474.1 hypothetical protein [Dyadobacter sp. LHD-138]
MTYINKIIYFLAKVWFAFVMLLALILTAILSVPFFILEWIDKSPADRQTMMLRSKIVRLNKTPS